MNSQSKAAALVQFLFERPLSHAEVARAAHPGFSIEEFRIDLLLGEESKARWPDLEQTYAQSVQSKAAKVDEPHKLALDIAELRMDLVGLQTRLDGLRSSFIDALRMADRSKEYLADVRTIQEQMRKVASRLERLDAAVIRLAS